MSGVRRLPRNRPVLLGHAMVWSCVVVLLCSPAGTAEDDVELAEAARAVKAMRDAGHLSEQFVIRLSELGRLYRAAREPVRAVATFDEAVAASETVFGPEHPDTAAAFDNRGELARETGDAEAACLAHERALAIRERALGVDHPITARSLNNLGLARLTAGDAKAAVALLSRAVATNNSKLGASHRATAVSLVNLGRAQLAAADADAAVVTFTRARDIRSASLGPRDPRTAQVEAALAHAKLATGAAADAESLLDDAYAVLLEALGERHPETLEALDGLVRATQILESRDVEKPGSEPRAKGRRRFYVREFLGIEWRDQFLSYPIAAAAGECRAQHARLSGPAGDIPVQLIDVTTWPDGSVRTALACFYANLSPFKNDLYTLRFDPADPTKATQAPQLEIARRGDRVEVRGRYVGAEFDLSTPRSGNTGSGGMPTPLVAMIAPDGSRFGGSEFFGNSVAESVEAAVEAAGPVLAEFTWRYGCQDGLGYELRATVGARDTAIQWDMRVTGDAPKDGWRIRLNDPGDAMTFVFQKKSFSAFESDPRVREAGELDWVRMPLVAGVKAINVAPWYQQYFDDQQTVVLLQSAQTAQIRYVMLRDAGAWVDPKWPRRFSESYPARLAKSMPVETTKDGGVRITAHCGTSPGGGVRRWAVGIARPDQIETISRLAAETKLMPASMVLGKWIEPSINELLDSRRLNRVKEYVLRWPRSRTRPNLFVTRSQIAQSRVRAIVLPGPAQAPQFPSFQSFVDHLAATRDGPWYEPWHHDTFALVAFLRGDKTAAEMRIRDRVFHHLGLLGRIDWMRDAGIVAALYDGTVDSGVFSESEARLLDAWMAYLCHVYADPNVTSIERGYNPGPPNITISYVLSLGVCACAVPDHPLARDWAEGVSKKLRYWLDVELGPEGEWFEGGHYDYVTLTQFTAFALAMRNAGFADLPSDPRLKLMAECLAQYATPPDPMRNRRRGSPPLGRRVAAGTWAVPGLMARLNVDKDAAFSGRLQWAWQGAGMSYRVPDDRLGGMEMLLMEPDLPTEASAWISRYFPRSGVVLRHEVGKPKESYLLLPTHWNESLAPYQVGSIAKWFARGVPVAGAFSDGDVDHHQLLSSHVVPAIQPRDAAEWQERAYLSSKGSVKASVMQPMADYVDVRLETPFPPFQGGSKSAVAGPPQPSTMPQWPTVKRRGHSPIEWRRQALFVKAIADGQPEYLVLRDTVVSDEPTMWLFWTLTRGLVESGAAPVYEGEMVQPARALGGDRFTGRGPWGTDLEYFVAEPRGTPRHTLRWGKHQDNPPPTVPEYQDLLHLQQSGSGSYFVVIFPRESTKAAPSFELLSPSVVRIRGDWGEDLVFVGDDTVRAKHDGIEIDSPVGVIRRDPEKDVVCLPAGGRCLTPRIEVKEPGTTKKIGR